MKEIVQEGAGVLREIAKPVPEKLFGTGELKRLVDDMAEALDRFPEGVALAAPQVGVSYRLFIVRKDRAISLPQPAPPATPPAPEIEVYVNPEIVKTSRRRAKVDEGCLSVHGVYGVAKRHERVTLRARDIRGARFTRGAGGLMAQIFEHEVDHLNGVLFIDHAERLIRIPPHPERAFAYFGTPKVASDTLEFLIERGFTPAVAVTAPDAPKGRGLALAPSETKVAAEKHGIPVLTPEKLDAGFIGSLRALGCEYAVVVAYGKIFPETLIAAFPKGVLNVHYSLLPKYRGATPLEAALKAGEEETGVTVQKMQKELDAGDILAQSATPISRDETARELRPRLIRLGAELLAETIPPYLSGALIPRPQDAAGATHARKLKKEDGLISLDAPAEENWNKYRAYADTIGTYFMEGGKRMRITKASLRNGVFAVERVVPEGKRETDYKANGRGNFGQ